MRVLACLLVVAGLTGSTGAMAATITLDGQYFSGGTASGPATLSFDTAHAVNAADYSRNPDGTPRGVTAYQGGLYRSDFEVNRIAASARDDLRDASVGCLFFDSFCSAEGRGIRYWSLTPDTAANGGQGDRLDGLLQIGFSGGIGIANQAGDDFVIMEWASAEGFETRLFDAVTGTWSGWLHSPATFITGQTANPGTPLNSASLIDFSDFGFGNNAIVSWIELRAALPGDGYLSEFTGLAYPNGDFDSDIWYAGGLSAPVAVTNGFTPSGLDDALFTAEGFEGYRQGFPDGGEDEAGSLTLAPFNAASVPAPAGALWLSLAGLALAGRPIRRPA